MKNYIISIIFIFISLIITPVIAISGESNTKNGITSSQEQTEIDTSENSTNAKNDNTEEAVIKRKYISDGVFVVYND